MVRFLLESAVVEEECCVIRKGTPFVAAAVLMLAVDARATRSTPDPASGAEGATYSQVTLKVKTQIHSTADYAVTAAINVLRGFQTELSKAMGVNPSDIPFEIKTITTRPAQAEHAPDYSKVTLKGLFPIHDPKLAAAAGGEQVARAAGRTHDNSRGMITLIRASVRSRVGAPPRRGVSEGRQHRGLGKKSR
jgi:hypothetical protein